MRRSEATTAAPGQHAPGAVASVLSRRQLVPLVAFAALCYLAAPYLGLGSREVDPRIAELWPPGGVGFVLLSTVWFLRRRLVVATIVAMVLTFVVTALAMGYAAGPAAWMGLLAVAQSALMVWLYRRGLSHSGWVPETPHDVAVLLGSAVGSSLVIGLAGGFPMLAAGDAFSKVLLWWVLRNTVFCFVGAVTFMVLFYGRRAEVLAPSPWYNRVGLLLIAVVCVYGTYLDPSLPLSWLLMIPSVWGGLTLTIRGTAYLTLTVALCAAAMTYLPQNQFGYVGVLPASSIVDLLVIASTAFGFLLTLMRDQRARLITELDGRRAESESQRELLEAVFESMNDGVMIIGEAGVTKHNSAARKLLGRAIPVGRPHSWAEAYALSTPDGRAITEDELRVALTLDDAHQTTDVEVVVGRDARARVLDVSAKAIGQGDRGSRLLLLHDVTAQRARLRELTNFAGHVAHDLRGPLTALDGWLEVLDDRAEGDALDPGVAEEVLVKARDASRRMRQVIEDWLDYTVVQNGQPRPVPVDLDAMAREIVTTMPASEGEHPEFTFDLDHAVQADPALLRQLLDNLVGNAVKYTAADVTPRVRLTSRRDLEPGWVRVEVSDNGIGIPEGEEELIFEEFHRGPAPGRSAGTGLGLALTRRIVALHGGQLTARLDPGGGSTFTFTLPEAP